MNEEESLVKTFGLSIYAAKAAELQDQLNKVFGLTPKETKEYFLVDARPVLYLAQGLEASVKMCFISDKRDRCKLLSKSMRSGDFVEYNFTDHDIATISQHIGLKPIE